MIHPVPVMANPSSAVIEQWMLRTLRRIQLGIDGQGCESQNVAMQDLSRWKFFSMAGRLFFEHAVKDAFAHERLQNDRTSFFEHVENLIALHVGAAADRPSIHTPTI